MTGSPIIKKIPGNVVKFDREKDGFVDFTKLSKRELLDLQQREDKLLKNRKFLNKLPDKGQKIEIFYEKVQAELLKRDEHEKLCGLLASLNVNDTKEKIDKLEWTGKCDDGSSTLQITDEVEVDPLKILATHSGTSASKEKQIKENEEKPLIEPSDIQENESDFDNVENYAKELCHRFDCVKDETSKNRFYTHRSLNATSVKELVKNDEPTVKSASTSDSTVKTKMLSLEESLVIQQQQRKHLKEVEMRHAMERLMGKTNITLGLPMGNFSEYRDQIIDSDDEACSVVSHEDDCEKDSVVYYNLVD